MTRSRIRMNIRLWLLLCVFVFIHGRSLADVGARQAQELVVKFGTQAEMLKTDGTGGTYVYEKKYFRSGGSFSLEVTRHPAFNLLGRVDFHVQVLSLNSPGRSIAHRIVTQSGSEKTVAAFHLLGHGPYLVRVRLDGDVRRVMEGQLFPARTNPPLPSESFSLAVKPAFENSGITLADQESFDKLARLLPDCDFGAAPKREPAELESIASVGPAAALTKVATIRLFGAGQELYVDIPPSWRKSGRSIYMKIEAKRFDDSNYRTVCSQFLLSRTSGYVLARVVTQGEWLDWRVETRFGRSDDRFRSEEPITFSRERFLSPPPMFAAGTDFDRTLSFVCFDHKTSDVTSSGTTDFAKSFHLDIRVRESSYKLSASQLREVERLSLAVASTWNRACVNCQPLNLSVITFNGNNFAHSAIAQWVRTKLAVPLDAEFLNMSLGVAKGRNRIGTDGISSSYQPIADLSTEFQDICKLQTLPSHANISELKRQVCNGAPRGAQSSTNILIDFVEGRTACGNNRNIIACRADNELTEFNVRDFKFVFSGSSVASVGNGKIEVDFSHVLLHEMGHWIGLGHIDSGNSAMASSLEQSRCIDAVTVERLSSVVASGFGDRPFPLAFTLEKRPQEEGRVEQLKRARPRR